MVAKSIVKTVVMVVINMAMILNIPPILFGFLYLKNSRHYYQILLGLSFHNIIANINQRELNKIMLVTYLRIYGKNCPHMVKVLFLIHNVVPNNKPTVLLPTLMIILITLLQIPCLCMHPILYIIYLQKQPCLLNLLHYLILYCHPHVVLLVILTLLMLPVVIVSYTPMVVHTLSIWPM